MNKTHGLSHLSQLVGGKSNAEHHDLGGNKGHRLLFFSGEGKERVVFIRKSATKCVQSHKPVLHVNPCHLLKNNLENKNNLEIVWRQERCHIHRPHAAGSKQLQGPVPNTGFWTAPDFT